MKPVIAGLISILLGCGHSAVNPPASAPVVQVQPQSDRATVLTINLSRIQNNPDFASEQTDNFLYKPEAGLDLQLRRVLRKNAKQAEHYLQNRKMFLDQTFKNNIAPYFGVIEVDPVCYALAKTEAVEKTTSSVTTFFMEFPMANPSVISECIGGPLVGIVRYDFFHCRKTHTVYEIRDFRKINQAALKLKVACE